jgi:hypothetical protein
VKVSDDEEQDGGKGRKSRRLRTYLVAGAILFAAIAATDRLGDASTRATLKGLNDGLASGISDLEPTAVARDFYGRIRECRYSPRTMSASAPFNRTEEEKRERAARREAAREARQARRGDDDTKRLWEYPLGIPDAVLHALKRSALKGRAQGILALATLALAVYALRKRHIVVILILAPLVAAILAFGLLGSVRLSARMLGSVSEAASAGGFFGALPPLWWLVQTILKLVQIRAEESVRRAERDD